MLLLLLLISILQIFLVPGLIALGRLHALNYIDRLLLAIPISFLVNYLIVVLLVLIGRYTQSAMIMVFAIETVALMMLNRHAWDKLPDLNPAKCYQGICNARYIFKGISLHKEHYLKAIVFLISLGLLAYLKVFSLWYGQFGTVIRDWDGIVSWHRWALSWYNGAFPVNYWTYPQVIPSLYSITYKFLGTSEISLAPKFVPIILCAIIPITAIRLAYLLRQIAFSEILLSIPIFFYLVFKTVYPEYAFSGGADMAMAYFGMLSIYCVTLSRIAYDRCNEAEYRQVMFWLAAVTSTSFIVKQVGIFASAFFPVGWYWVTRNLPMPMRNRRIILLGIGALAVLIPAHWYLYVFLKSSSPISDVSIYEPLLKSAWYLRPYEGVKMLYTQMGWWPLAFFVLGAWVKAFRILLLPFISVYLAWSLIASYDTRNLYVVLPIFAFLIAAGIVLVVKFGTHNLFHVIENWLLKHGKPTLSLLKLRLPYTAGHSSPFILSKRRYGLLIVVLCVGATYYLSKQDYSPRLINKSFREQMKIGSEGMNYYLYEVFREKYAGTGVLIGTDYQPMPFVPKLQEFYYHAHSVSLKDFSAAFLNKRVRFILTTNDCANEVAEYLDAGLTEGRYKLLHEANGHRLLEIVKPENNCREYLRLNPTSSWGKCE